MGLEIVFLDHPIRKQAFLDKKISILHTGHTGIVSKGLTHDFVQKLEKISSQCDFGQMSLKIMFDDHPSRKQALLDHTNIDFTQLIFSKELTRDFGRRLENSYLLVFGQK